jgi:hypothetical protein
VASICLNYQSIGRLASWTPIKLAAYELLHGNLGIAEEAWQVFALINVMGLETPGFAGLMRPVGWFGGDDAAVDHAGAHQSLRIFP